MPEGKLVKGIAIFISGYGKGKLVRGIFYKWVWGDLGPLPLAAEAYFWKGIWGVKMGGVKWGIAVGTISQSGIYLTLRASPVKIWERDILA